MASKHTVSNFAKTPRYCLTNFSAAALVSSLATLQSLSFVKQLSIYRYSVCPVCTWPRNCLIAFCSMPSRQTSDFERGLYYSLVAVASSFRMVLYTRWLHQLMTIPIGGYWSWFCQFTLPSSASARSHQVEDLIQDVAREDHLFNCDHSQSVQSGNPGRYCSNMWCNSAIYNNGCRLSTCHWITGCPNSKQLESKTSYRQWN